MNRPADFCRRDDEGPHLPRSGCQRRAIAPTDASRRCPTRRQQVTADGAARAVCATTFRASLDAAQRAPSCPGRLSSTDDCRSVTRPAAAWPRPACGRLAGTGRLWRGVNSRCSMRFCRAASGGNRTGCRSRCRRALLIGCSFSSQTPGAAASRSPYSLLRLPWLYCRSPQLRADQARATWVESPRRPRPPAGG